MLAARINFTQLLLNIREIRRLAFLHGGQFITYTAEGVIMGAGNPQPLYLPFHNRHFNNALAYILLWDIHIYGWIALIFI